MHAGNTAFLANSENFEDFELAGLEYWRICDELTIVQAGLLIAGRDPSVDGEYIESWEPAKWPLGYAAAKTAISNALRRKKITGEVFPVYDYDFNGNACGEIPGSIDVRKSRVEVESLRTWLAGRGLKTGFFFPQPQVRQDYLDSKNPRYAPKLAAAVLAWEAIGGEAIMSGKSPKQLLWRATGAPLYMQCVVLPSRCQSRRSAIPRDNRAVRSACRRSRSDGRLRCEVPYRRTASRSGARHRRRCSRRSG
jgi:hypothetical protein